MKVPDVKRCCLCFPLRFGIVFFGIINTVMSGVAIVELVISKDLHKTTTMATGTSRDLAYLEMVSTTILLSIFGMGVILNILLLIGGCQKDASLMRLYNCYALATVMAALLPMGFKLWRLQYIQVISIFLAIVMQCYVVILVRSEVIKLERKQCRTDPEQRAAEYTIEVPDCETLL